MFLSAPSFATLNGKALFCASTTAEEYLEDGDFGKFVFFFKENTYEHYVLYLKNDVVFVGEHFQNKEKINNIYKTDPNFVYLRWLPNYKRYDLVIGRKSGLLYDDYYDKSDYKAICSIQTIERAAELLYLWKDKSQKEYNKKLKGNKF